MTETYNQVDRRGMCHTIGEIDPVKDDSCTLHFITHTCPASTVWDERGQLICFFAKQVANNAVLHEEDFCDSNASTRTLASGDWSQADATGANDQYYYFFSPFYFGESPVACIGPPEIKAGRRTVTIYTFKRKYDEQPVAERRGFYGERMYAHGILTHNDRANKYELYRCPQERKEVLKFPTAPYLTGTETRCNAANLSERLQLLRCSALRDIDLYYDDMKDFRNVEFHRPGVVGGSIISVDGRSELMTVAEGSDIIEDVCIWAARNVYLGRRITAE